MAGESFCFFEKKLNKYAPILLGVLENLKFEAADRNSQRNFFWNPDLSRLLWQVDSQF